GRPMPRSRHRGRAWDAVSPLTDHHARWRLSSRMLGAALIASLLLPPTAALAADPVAVGGAGRADDTRGIVDSRGDVPANSLQSLLAIAMSEISSVAAADEDGDGIPAAAEALLGLDPA